MEPTEYKAAQLNGMSWSVFACNSTSKCLIASGISSGETARIIAGLLQRNSFSADAIESGNVAIVHRDVVEAAQS